MRDLTGKVTHLEKEKEKIVESTERLVRALKGKTTAVEEKKKECVEKEKEATRLEAELTLLRSREMDQGAFSKLVVEKVLQTTGHKDELRSN